MNNLEARVRDLFETAAPEPAGSLDTYAIAHRINDHRRRARVLLPIAAAALVAGIVALALAFRPGDKTSRPTIKPATASTTLSYTGVSLTLTHPKDWTYQSAFDGSFGPVVLTGYMAAHVQVHAFVPQCTKTRISSTCSGGDPYVTRLPRGAVFITFSMGGSSQIPAGVMPSRNIGGSPAFVHPTTADQCPPGTTSGLIVSIWARQPNSTFYTTFGFKGCTSTPDTAKALNTMLSTAEISTR